YDTPENVFNHPVNTFVASFIGSPAMSLVPLELIDKGGLAALTGPGGWELMLSPQNTAKVRNATAKKVVLGARHSTIKLHEAPAENSVPAKVYTVEPTGDITFAQVWVGDSIVIVSVEPRVKLKPDQQVWI